MEELRGWVFLDRVMLVLMGFLTREERVVVVAPERLHLLKMVVLDLCRFCLVVLRIMLEEVEEVITETGTVSYTEVGVQGGVVKVV
jgi:hypothetical protein